MIGADNRALGIERNMAGQIQRLTTFDEYRLRNAGNRGAGGGLMARSIGASSQVDAVVRGGPDRPAIFDSGAIGSGIHSFASQPSTLSFPRSVATHRAGNARSPYTTPARLPAIAAVVSVSLPSAIARFTQSS